MSSPSEDLAARALAFAVRCHADHRRESDGEPFITHSLEVARLLRDAGCSERVVAAGLLHDVVETNVTFAEIAARFGDDVAALVRGVTGDARIEGYRLRKQLLRDQVRFAGGDVALLFAADKISSIREWPRHVGRQRARMEDLGPDDYVRRYVERHHAMRLEHYTRSLAMLRRIAPEHPLVRRLADELERCTTLVAAGI